MRTTVATRLFLLALSLAIAGLTREADAAGVAASVAIPRHELSADMASLVPADAVGLLVLRSSAAAAEELAVFQPRGGEHAPLDLPAILMRPIGLGSQRLDPHRPLAVALSLPSSAPGAPNVPMMAPPIITYVLPVADLEGLRSDLASSVASAATVVEAGDYVGISMIPGYAASGTAGELARGLPDRSIVLRLKAARLIDAFRPFIDMGLTNLRAHTPAMARPDSAVMSPALAAQLRASQDMQAAMLEHTVKALLLVPTVDLALGQSDGLMQFDCALQMEPGARKAFGVPAASPGLVELARCLPQDMPLLAVGAADFEVMADMYEPWFQSMVSASASSPTSMAMTPERADAAIRLMRLMGPHLGVAATCTEAGIAGVSVFTSRDPQAYVDGLRTAVEQHPLPSFPETIAKGPKLQGRPTWIYTQKLDMAALASLTDTTDSRSAAAKQQAKLLSAVVGKDGVKVWISTLDDKVVTAAASDKRLLDSTLKGLKKKKGRLPAALEAMDPAAREQLTLWSQATLRDLVVPIAELVQKADPDPDPEVEAVLAKLRAMPPTMMSMRAFATDDALEGSCGVDIVGFRQMLDSFPRPKRGQAPAEQQPD